MSQFFGVDAVILVFAVVDEVQVEPLGQNEGDGLGLTGVGQPVSAEHASGTDREAVAVRLNQRRKYWKSLSWMLQWISFLPCRSMTQT